jgi:hypothetical protein
VFYTPETAADLGLADHGERCLGCSAAARCDYRLDIEADRELKALYLEAESADGYCRDRCVFAPDITIEDNMQVLVRYANGVFMNYTLNAHSPWEGYVIIFYGTEGELTHKHVEVHGTFGGERDDADESVTSTTLHVHGKPAEALEVWSGEGDHSGGDPVMLAYLLDPGDHRPRQIRPRLDRDRRGVVHSHRTCRKSLDRNRHHCQSRRDADGGQHPLVENRSAADCDLLCLDLSVG